MLMQRLSIALLTLPLSLTLLHAQTSAPVQAANQAPSQTTLTTSTTVVLVPALVTSKQGEPVYTLTANDFTVTDDGIPQKLTLEEDSDSEPLALVVAIQTGGAAATRLDRYQKLAPLIEAMVGNVPHKIAIVTFGSTPRLALDFTPGFTPNESTNSAPLAEAIHDLHPDDPGAAILDTLGYAVDLLRDQPPQYRRAILLISETVDDGSKMKIDDALRVISDTNTAIYSLGFSSTRAYAGKHTSEAFNNDYPGPKGGCMANPKKGMPAETDSTDLPTSDTPTSDTPTSDTADAVRPKPDNRRTGKQISNQAVDCLGTLLPPVALAKMALMSGLRGLRKNIPETVADLTGGEYFSFKNPKDIDRDLITFANHVPNRYILSFHPQSPHPGIHAINLKLKAYPNLDVASRSSYWAEQDPATTTAHP